MVTVLAVLVAGPASYRIEGDGWFRFRREGRAVYASSVELVARGGRLESTEGLPLWPEVAVTSEDFVVAADGTVTCGGAATGTIVLAYFETQPVTGPGGLASSPERPLIERARAGTRIVSADRGFQTPVAAPSATAPPQTALPTRLTLKASTEVLGLVVTVQDVVEQALPLNVGSLVVTTSPPIGARLALDSTRVEAKLRASGAMPSDWPGLGSRMTVQVARATNAVPHSKLVETAVQSLAAEHPGEWEALDSPGDFALPVGKVELKAERSTVSGKTASVVVALFVDGARYNSRTVRLQRKPVANLPVRGAVVAFRVVAGSVVVESRGTVTAVDSTTGDVTLRLDTGATVVGRMAQDGTVEVRR